MRINDRNQVKNSMVKAGSSFYLMPTDKVKGREWGKGRGRGGRRRDGW